MKRAIPGRSGDSGGLAMTSYQHSRDEFLVRMGSYGVSVNDLRKLLRLAETKQRLAVAQCNGDWPAETGKICAACRDAKPEHYKGGIFVGCTCVNGRAWASARCPVCDGGWHPSTIKSTGCPDCRVEAQIRALVASWNPPCTCQKCAVCKDDTICGGCGMCSRCHEHAPDCSGCPHDFTKPDVKVTIQGDPRGWCVRLVVEGREIGVPVRGK